MSSHPNKPTLKLDWCSHEAAKYAVEHWHYSRSMPSGKTVKIGVWEDTRFIGAVIFARGSNQHIGSDFGLTQTQAVELVRVALDKHITPVSRILAIASKMLTKTNPGLRLVVSFADPNEGHIGTIYQAGGWTYTGYGTTDHRCRAYKLRGKTFHWRTVAGVLSARGLPSTVEAAQSLGYVPQPLAPKYRYLYPLDDAMRAQIAPLAKPYPKRAGVVQPVEHAGPLQDGGSKPTHPLEILAKVTNGNPTD